MNEQIRSQSGAEAGARPQFRQCFGCNYESSTGRSICPRCGRSMFSSTNIRIRGTLLAIGGTFLAAFMVWIGVNLGLHQGVIGDPSSIPGYTGSPQILMVVYVLFGALIALGINFGVIGGWMLIFGKRNRVLNWIMLAFLLMVLLGVVGIYLYAD